MAADALGAYDAGLTVLAEGDGLVPAVPAGNVAAATADAGVAVDDRVNDRRAVQVRGADEVLGVSTIPHLFLFDPDGKIVQQDMRGEGIDALLRTVFK